MQIAPRPRRLHAGRGRSPPPRHGQEDQGRDGRAARPLHHGRGRARHRPRRRANTIFDACAKFAEYGFNKSHSAPYALITYQTAYMKANYPVEFLAASMTLETGNTDKIAEFRREAIRLGITVEAPSVNRSSGRFRRRRTGASSIRSPRSRASARQAVEHLVEVRGDKPFRDLADFGRRINPRLINKRVLESLVAAGALDELEPDRARVHAGVDRILGVAARAQDSAAVGQSELFGGSEEREPLLLPAVEPWLPAERLQREHDAVGFYLSAHPLDEYRPSCRRCACRPGRSSPSRSGAGRPPGALPAR